MIKNINWYLTNIRPHQIKIISAVNIFSIKNNLCSYLMQLDRIYIFNNDGFDIK